MKLTRRTVLGAVGTLGVGAGAAFGSGAFTSTTAERAVEVNVFGTNGLVRDGDNEDDVAGVLRRNAVDVLVDTRPDTVSVSSPDLGDDEGGTDLFPTEPGGLTGYGQVLGEDQNGTAASPAFVSLIANDVTIVFGDEDGLPPNSRVDYVNLFAFVPGSNTDGPAFNVTFDGPGELLTKVAGHEVSGGATVEGIEPVNFLDRFNEDDIPDRANAEVTTGTTSPETEQLNIRIERQDD